MVKSALDLISTLQCNHSLKDQILKTVKIVYKKTDEKYNEWQRVATNDKWQQVTTNDNEWQGMTTSDKKKQWTTTNVSDKTNESKWE